MGNVYQVEHVMLRKHMAMKLLRPEYSSNPEIVRRFQNEAVAAGSIGQDHIVSVTDFGSTAEGLVYLVMEELQGCSLADAIARGGGLAPPRALDIAEQICRALGAAHDAGIIHRDLKPDNVFVLERDGRDFVKVLDFGISKVSELGQGEDQRFTRTGMILGTPEYMSPEQAAGRQVDRRTDVYSMGVLLFELLTGRLPFTADNPIAILMKHQTEEPPPFSAVRPGVRFPDHLEPFVRRLMAKKPEDRPKDMGECISSLRALQTQSAPHTQSAPRTERPMTAEPAPARSRAPISPTVASIQLQPGDRLQVAQDLTKADLLPEEGLLAARVSPAGSTVAELVQISGLPPSKAAEILGLLVGRGVLARSVVVSPIRARPSSPIPRATPAATRPTPRGEERPPADRRGLVDKNPLVNRFVRKQLLVQRGREELARGHMKEAIDNLRAAAGLDPKDSELQALLRDVLGRSDEAEAEQSFRSGLEAEARRDFDGALEHFRKAMALHPENARYLERVARKLLYRESQIKEAKRLSERAVELAPRDAEARATLARAYLQAGLKAKAKRELDVVLELQKDHKFAKSQLKQFRWWNLA